MSNYQEQSEQQVALWAFWGGVICDELVRWLFF